MTEARTRVLGAIRASLSRERLPEETLAALDRRLQEPRPNVVPARGQLPAAERVALFIDEAEKVNASTERLPALDAVPAAVMTFLRASNLPATLRTGTDALVDAVPRSREPLLQRHPGAASGDDAVSLTSAFAGIAETGTLMLLSGTESPTSLNFLPAAHIVLLPTQRIVGTYEDAWQRLRAELGSGAMPRVVNWITGPSRTADIEQTLLLGAHGPKRLHIMIVDGEDRSQE
jgi:L-lactate dehydrogenase complex protein LldG